MKISDSQKRLHEMMDILGIKQTDIVNKTGINKSSLSNYLNGRRTPTQEQLSRIADPYKINPAWLMGYDVPMQALDGIVYYVNDSYNIDSQNGQDKNVRKAIELYEMYINADPEIQRAVELLLKSAQQHPESPDEP